MVATLAASVLPFATPEGALAAEPPDAEAPNSLVVSPHAEQMRKGLAPEGDLVATPTSPLDIAENDPEPWITERIALSPDDIVLQVLWHDAAERFIVVSRDRLLAVDRNGQLLAQTERAEPNPQSTAVLSGGELMVMTHTIVEVVDLSSLERLERWAFTHFVASVAAVDGELIVRGATETVSRLDRETGVITGEEMINPSSISSVWHQPVMGSRVLLMDGTNAFLADLSTTPPTVVHQVEFAGTLIDIDSGGTAFFEQPGQTSVVERSLVDLSEVSTTPGGADTFASAAGALIDRRSGTIRSVGSGTTLATLPRWAYNGAFTPDARQLLMGLGNELQLWSTAPTVRTVDQDLFRPGLYDEVRVRMSGLPVTEVTVNGQAVPHRIVTGAESALTGVEGEVLAVDVSQLPDTSNVDATLTFRSALGETTLNIPGTPDRGWSEVAISVDRDGGAGTNAHVECGFGQPSLLWRSRPVLVPRDATLVAVVPSSLTCVVEARAPRRFISGGPWPTDSEGPFHFYGDRVPFESGRTFHAHLRVSNAPLPRSFWMFTFPVGDPPAGTRYPFRVTCGTWENDIIVTSGAGVEVVLPEDAADRCELRLRKRRGASDVSSAIVGNGDVVESAGQSITVRADRLRQRNQFVGFVLDHDGADFVQPLVVGSPEEKLGKAARAGVVHVLPVDGNGSPTGSGAEMLRQGRAPIGGRAERGDGFGSAVATGDFDGNGIDDVAIGAPLENIAGKSDVGVVHVVYGTTSGYLDGSHQLFRQGVNGLSGRAQSGDRFGSALAVTDFDGDGFDDLIIGAPGDRVNGVSAGTVQIVFGGPQGLDSSRAESLTQNTSGFLDKPDDGDEFGAAVSANRGLLAIGVPGEDRSGKADRGLMHLYDGHRMATPAESSNQRLIGRNAGDRLGEAVLLTDEVAFAGAPSERVRGNEDYGRVHWVRLSVFGDDNDRFAPLGRRARQTLWPRTSIDRSSGDRFGASLAALPGPDASLIAVGAPGLEGTGGVALLHAGGGLFSVFDNDTEALNGRLAAGDGFGTSVTFSRGGSLIVGAPDAAEDGAQEAGRIFFTVFTDDGIEWGELHQDSRGVGSRAEKKDRFGGSLAG